MKIENGATCTLNGAGDLAMDFDARPFIGSKCVVIKTTKAGLVQVALVEDRRRTYSAPQRNVEEAKSGNR